MVGGSLSLRVCRLTGLLLCCWFIGVQGSVPKNCSVNPLVVPFEDVVVIFAPDRTAAHRSMAWRAGSQGVPLGMQVGTTLNSSFMPEAKVCTDNIDRGCVFWRGGIFQTNQSTTWVKDEGTVPYNASRANKGWDYLNAEQYQDSDPISKFPRGWDNFQVEGTNGDYIELDGYPMVTIDNGSFPFGQGMIGLASDSSFLEVVVEKGQSPTKSWALDYGLTSPGKSEPGELVFGGYNRAKADPDGFTNYQVFPDKSKPCPLQVQVTGLKWGNVDLMDGQPDFLACIEPAYWTTIMPIRVRSNFNKTMLTGQNVSFWSSDWEYMKYNNSDPSLLPAGDFTITLDGGFNVTMPREEWIFPATEVNHGFGQWDLVPDLIQTTIGTAGFNATTEPKLPFLGSPFLSQVYLRVDYESGIFGIAKTTRYGNDGNPEPSLVKLGCDDYASSVPITPTSQSPSSTPTPTPKKSKTPVIAGAVVGSVVGLALIAGAALCFIYRRKKENVPEAAVLAPNQTKEQSEVQSPGFNQQHPYDAPPAFSPTSTPAPYTPTTSPGPYIPTGLAGIPARRPVPGQNEYYNNQNSLHVPSMGSEPAELRGSDITSELSGRPRSQHYSGAFSEGGFDETSVVSGQTGKH